VVNTAGVKAGNSTAIVGLGGVGFCAVLGALASGARHVIAVDLHESKLNQALSLGATAAFNAKDPDLLKKSKSSPKVALISPLSLQVLSMPWSPLTG